MSAAGSAQNGGTPSQQLEALLDWLPMHACLTGDCGHDDRRDCNGALADELRALLALAASRPTPQPYHVERPDAIDYPESRVDEVQIRIDLDLGERFVRVAVELLEQLKAAPSEPVTFQIEERDHGELHFVVTRSPVARARGADFLTHLQEVGAARSRRWHPTPAQEFTGLEWAGAMCGEAGEAANVAKKLRRAELAIAGNAASERPALPPELIEKLGRELADTLIYMVNVASHYGISLADATVDAFNKKSIEMGFPERISREVAP